MSWIEAKALAEKHNFSYLSMMSMRSQGRYPEYIFKKSGKDLYVYEYYFLLERERQNSIVQFNQSMYYWMSDVLTDADIVKLLAGGKLKEVSVSNYITKELFMFKEKSLANIQLGNVEFQVYKRFKRIEKHMKKIQPKWDVEFVLDYRAGLVA